MRWKGRASLPPGSGREFGWSGHPSQFRARAEVREFSRLSSACKGPRANDPPAWVPQRVPEHRPKRREAKRGGRGRGALGPENREATGKDVLGNILKRYLAFCTDENKRLLKASAEGWLCDTCPQSLHF